MTTAKTAVKAAEPVLEEVAEVLDETIETVARIPRLRLNGTTRGQQIVILTVTAAVGAAAGSAATYFIVRKRLETKFDLLLAEQTEAARKYYRTLNKKEEFADPVTALAKYGEEVAQLGYDGTDAPVEEAALEEVAEEFVEKIEVTKEDVKNIFTDSAPIGTLDIEQQDEARPFVILKDDYLVNDLDYDQNNLTYYLKDGTLADENDREIPEHQTNDLVGDENLLRFGHGSGDNNVVYVRNHAKKMEFEIIRSTGSYAHEVHGFDDTEATLRHSERQPRRFRPNRD